LPAAADTSLRGEHHRIKDAGLAISGDRVGDN
jgi:hypothetical protein